VTTRWARLVASSRILDVVVIAFTVALAFTSILTSEPFGPSALNLALVALACVALPWRNRYPEPVLAVALLAFVATGTPAPAMLAMGSLAAVHGSRVRTSIAAGAASVVVVVPELDNPDPLRPLLVWGVLICLPTAVGLYLRSRQDLIEEAVARADALADAQHTLAESARRDERTRIAREMHDVVAHQVSLIALHAGALELTEQGTPAGKTAELIRQTARQALDELRTVVTVLRTDPGDDERSPQATVAGLEDTVEEWQKAGTDVTLHDRTSPGFLDTMSARAGRTAYRIVREALTNASKHAPGSIIEVELDDVDGSLEVVVHSSPATRVSSRASSGAGTGLFGLRERVELLGGRFEAGPDGQGGFRVWAMLPPGTGEL
jgi:signal transduction histidine kinase